MHFTEQLQFNIRDKKTEEQNVQITNVQAIDIKYERDEGRAREEK